MGKDAKVVYEYPKWIMASYGSRELFSQWISAAFGFTVFFYYEVVVGLDVTLAAAAFIIYSIWNSINDPFTGYLMEHFIFPWEKKTGFRRMPFIVVGGILWLVSYLAIFLGPTGLDPVADKWPIFAWYIVSICVYDFFCTLFDVNAASLFPEKFRGLNDRRMAQSFGTIFGVIGVVLSAVIPPMFITTGVAATYRNAALVTVIIGLVFLLLLLPGTFETKAVRELYKRRRESVEDKKLPGFFKTAKTVLSNKRFVSKITLYLGYQVGVVMLQMSAFYIVTYLLDAPASNISYLLGSMLVGALISVPVWMLVSQRLNNNRALSIFSGLFMFLTFLPMIFVEGLTGWIISLVAFGIALGGQWFMDPPTMGDVLDDVAVKTGRRDPGVYIGYQSFIFKLGQTSIAAVIAIVHTNTGFVSGAPSLTQLMAVSPTPELALFGIRIHSAIVPAIAVLISTIIFWRFYDLTPDKVAANKAKLEELGM